MLSINTKSPVTHSMYRKELTKKIVASQVKVRETIASTGSAIIHRTQASNIKMPNTIHEEQQAHEGIMSAQIKAWRAILPKLITRFSHILTTDALKVLSIN